MQSNIHCDYGAADALQFGSASKVQPSPEDALIKVHTASLGPLGWHFLRGTPYFSRTNS